MIKNRFDHKKIQDLVFGNGTKGYNEEVKEKAHPMKYLFRIFPITKEAVTMGAIFDDDFRKEWGVKIN